MRAALPAARVSAARTALKIGGYNRKDGQVPITEKPMAEWTRQELQEFIDKNSEDSQVSLPN